MVSVSQILRVVLSGSLIISVAFLYYSSQNRDTRGAKSLAVVFGGGFLWVLSDLIQISTPGRPMAFGGMSVRMLGGDILVIAILLIGLEYTGREKYINKKLFAFLGIKPVLTQILLIFPETRSLMFSTVACSPDVPCPWGYELVRTPLFMAHATYNWGIAFVGMSMLTYMMIRSSYGYRRQIFALLVAFVVPTSINILFNIGVLPFDITPTSFVFSGIVLVYATFRLRLLDAIPVARETVLEEMDEMVLVLDEKGGVVMVNDAVEDMFGIEARLTGLPVEKMLGEDAPANPEKGDEVVDISFTIDGEEQYLNVNKSVITDYRGNVLAQLLVCSDITEHRERERELERSRELLARTEELSDVGGWEYDFKLDEVRMTDGMYQILDIPEDHVPTLGSILSFYRSDDRDTLEEAIKQSVSDEEPFRIEGRITTNSGRKRWVTVAGKPYYEDKKGDDERTVRGVRGAIRDITEEKRREKKLENKNEQLDQFATTVSHDLRNPLNIAMAHLEFARDTGEKENFDTAEQALRRIDEMIEDILEFARAGGSVEDKESTSVSELAERAWANVETNGASLSLEDDTEVRADEERLLNVFENLFRNSVEHGPKNGSDGDEIGNGNRAEEVTVTVGTLNAAEGFYIEDDGKGIPHGERQEVFDQGYTTSEEGTGFGLTIVNTIIKAHNWEIDVTESEDGGARFEIRT